MADDDGKPQVHKSCRALALSLVKWLDQSACMQEEKRSYKDCALDKNLTASPSCRDVRDNYIKCKHEQVGLVVRERLFNNPETLRLCSRRGEFCTLSTRHVGEIPNNSSDHV